MNSIQIQKIAPPCVLLFSPTKEFLGSVNEYELLAFRVEIRKTRAEGYYIKCQDGLEYMIDKDGRFPDYPPGVFGIMDRYLTELF